MRTKFPEMKWILEYAAFCDVMCEMLMSVCSSHILYGDTRAIPEFIGSIICGNWPKDLNKVRKGLDLPPLHRDESKFRFWKSWTNFVLVSKLKSLFHVHKFIMILYLFFLDLFIPEKS